MLETSKNLIMFSQREVALGRKECEFNGEKILLGSQVAIIKIINFKENTNEM